MRRTLMLDESEYTVVSINGRQARLLDGNQDGDGDTEFYHRLIAQSLIAGGHDITANAVMDLPYFLVLVPLLEAAKQVNGFKAIAKSGEDLAAALPAAQSTSDGSTLT